MSAGLSSIGKVIKNLAIGGMVMIKRIVCILLVIMVAVPMMYSKSIAAGNPDWPKVVTQGSGPVGGTFFSLCGGWLKVMETLGVEVTCRVTGAAVANTKLIQSGSVDFAIGALSAEYEGYTGTGWAKGQKYDRIRGMFVVYPHFMQPISLPKSGITKTSDLNGKKVHFGSTGGMNYTLSLRYFEAAGVKPSKIVTGNWSDANNLLRDGLVDIVFLYGSAPHPSVNEAVTTFGAQILNLDKNVVEKLVNDFPYISQQSLPAKVYGEKQPNPAYTFGDWVVYFTHKDMPEDFVYEIVKATMDNKGMMVAAASAANHLSAENIVRMSIPLHKGAYRYYREKGIEVPKHAMPID